MKRQIYLCLFAVLFFSSCSTYYQIYKAVPVDDIKLKDDFLVYENEDCQISYNMWADGGNMGFVMYNKTTEDIHLKLDECFYVLNGFAYNYFQNRVFTTSKATSSSTTFSKDKSTSVSGFNYNDLIQTNKIEVSKSTGNILTSATSVSYNEEKDICIPPKTSKVITEYSISKKLYRDCDLFRFPTATQIKTLTFDRKNSPIVFSNIITYTMGQAQLKERIKNEFFVKEITNYPDSKVVESKRENFCGQKGYDDVKRFKITSPDMFYLNYSSEGNEAFKH